MFAYPAQGHERYQGLWQVYRTYEIKKVSECTTPSFLPLLLQPVWSFTCVYLHASWNLYCLPYGVVSLLCDIFGIFPPVSAAEPLLHLTARRLQVERICGRVSWLGSSFCRVEIKFLSHWTIYRRYVQDLLRTSWGPLWYFLRGIDTESVPLSDQILCLCVYVFIFVCECNNIYDICNLIYTVLD